MLIAMQIVVVAPFVARWFARLDRAARGWALLAAVAGTMALLGLLWGPFLDSGPVLSAVFGIASDRIFVFWSAYIAIGVVIGLDHERASELLRKARPLLVLAYIGAASAVGWLVWQQAVATGGDFAATAEISRVMQPWVVPFELLSVLVWLDLGGLLARTRASSTLRLLAGTSFGGYLIHPFWITIGSSLVLERFPAPMPYVTVSVLALFALVASVVMTMLLWRVRSPLGEALVGRRPAATGKADRSRETPQPAPPEDSDSAA